MRRLLYIISAFLFCGTSLWGQNRSYQNPELLKYIQGGASKNGILELAVKPEYSSLTQEQQKQLLLHFYKDFSDSKILVRINDRESQLWMPQDNGYTYASSWNIDELPIKDYGPLELNKYGDSRFFYYVGGSFGSSNGTSSGMLNLRGGTFLYKNIWEISASLGLGYSRAEGSTHFNGEIGASTRAFLPWRIPKLNLAPYAGIGASLYFSPKAMFDGQLLVGCSWFIGPGSLDFGLKYGIQSGFGATFGYTFRPVIKIKR